MSDVDIRVQAAGLAKTFEQVARLADDEGISRTTIIGAMLAACFELALEWFGPAEQQKLISGGLRHIRRNHSASRH